MRVLPAHSVLENISKAADLGGTNPLFARTSAKAASKPSEKAVTAAGVPPPPPTLNEFIEVYGAHLYAGAFQDAPGFEYGRATALGSLGRIFTARRSSNVVVHPLHLSRFYLAVRKGLASDDPRLV